MRLHASSVEGKHRLAAGSARRRLDLRYTWYRPAMYLGWTCAGRSPASRAESGCMPVPGRVTIPAGCATHSLGSHVLAGYDGSLVVTITTRLGVPMSEPSIRELEALRDRLYAELSAAGDFRRGSVSENWRRGGKPNGACAGPGHPGHGPRVLWTRSEGRRKGV